MIRRPAFTLLELLVSSALFAIIVVLVVGVIATTTVSQNAGLQSQTVSSELQREMSTIQSVLSRSTVAGFENYQGGDGTQNGANSFLIFQTTDVQADGSGAGTAGPVHYEVWCVNQSPIAGWQDTLLQITMPTNAVFSYPPSSSDNNVGDTCYTSTVAGWFTDGSGHTLTSDQVATNEITDNAVKINGFSVQSVQALGDTTDNTQAFSIEIAGTYIASGEQRSDAQLSQPIVVRGIAVLVSNPSISNLSQ